jgi:aminopyrrolnitrin oxygenase
MNEPSERFAPAIVSIPRAPLPDWPQGWYVVARSGELKPGALRSVSLAGRDIVVFRTQSGALGGVDAYCPHMGAHLGHGRVRGEHLVCPLHGRQIGCDGTITESSERSRAWTLRERFGLIMLELGSARALPEASADDFDWTNVAPLEIAAGWHSLVANAFDMPHLCTVHFRELVAPTEVSCDAGRRFALHYISCVRGRGLSDRVMKWLSGDRIDVRVECYGTVTMVETDLGFTRTAVCIGMTPTEQGTRLHVAFGVRHGSLQTLRLALTRWLFTAFLRRDIGVVEGMRLKTQVDDPVLERLFDFLRTLRPMPG